MCIRDRLRPAQHLDKATSGLVLCATLVRELGAFEAEWAAERALLHEQLAAKDEISGLLGAAGEDVLPILDDNSEPLDLDKLTAFLEADVNPQRCVLDSTASEEVASYYERWLEAGISVICPSKVVASGPIARYDAVAAKCAEGRSGIVYAEGTRNPTGEKMPLRVGLIKLAYDRRIPLYVSMVSNKYDIVDEKRLRVTIGADPATRKPSSNVGAKKGRK